MAERANTAKPRAPMAIGSASLGSRTQCHAVRCGQAAGAFHCHFPAGDPSLRDCGRFVRGYVAGKLRRDPVHRDVLGLATGEAFGEVIDIGCGRGQLALALLEAGLARSVRASIAKADIWSRQNVPLAVWRSAQSCAIWRKRTMCLRRPRCCWSTSSISWNLWCRSRCYNQRREQHNGA